MPGRAQPHGEYPLLHTLHDHCAGAALLSGELPRLSAELDRTAARFTGRSQSGELPRLLAQAIAEGGRRYARTD